MKIGLLTYYGDLNFGTNLQAYATLLALKSIYPHDEVEIIPLHTFWLRIIPYKSFNPVSIYRDYIRIKKFAQFKRVNLQVVEKEPNITSPQEALDYIASRNYDVIYVGADTLLELDRLPKGYDGLSCYWLKDIKAKKIIVAASAKNTQFELLSKKQQADMVSAVSQFSKIAVRDRATYSLFANCVDKEHIEMIPDPTFSLKIDYSFVETYLKEKKISFPNKTVYINSASSDEWLSKVVDELKENGYCIVTPRPTGWTDLSLNDMGPLEQAGIFKYVSFVISHRFHEGVFCLKNHTPFILYAPNGMMTANGESKHVSLLKDFNLYPYSFLGSIDTAIYADNVLGRLQQVRALFKIEQIDSVMEKNKTSYMKFVEEAKNTIND